MEAHRLQRPVLYWIRLSVLGGLFSIMLLAASSLVVAQQDVEPATAEVPEEEQEDAAPGPVTEAQALERVRERFEGTVISISEVEQEERIRFRIRMDDEGNIFTVYVDQATGRVSRE